MTAWTLQDIPDQTGRIAVITGATGGLGYETALALAGKGGHVVLTGRNAGKGDAALTRIRAIHPRADLRYEHLDLTSLASVAAFAERFSRDHTALDILINNAGVMMPPKRLATSDNFELQWGTNYLGHFALTAHLLPLLRKASAPRVVNLSSMAHKFRAAIHFDDLDWNRSYSPWPAYAQSKLAMLMFALELQRRSDANGWRLMSNAAHPGYARTDLIANGPGNEGLVNRIGAKLLEPLASHSAAAGAMPTLYAATDPGAENAAYYGPNGPLELRGDVSKARISKQAGNVELARRLWDVSLKQTGAKWPEKSEG